jgi:hypothetical protein
MSKIISSILSKFLQQPSQVCQYKMHIIFKVCIFSSIGNKDKSTDFVNLFLLFYSEEDIEIIEISRDQNVFTAEVRLYYFYNTTFANQ